MEVGRILEQNGFVEVRQRGSRRIMQRRLEATTITVPVPLHDPLRRGTLIEVSQGPELEGGYASALAPTRSFSGSS
ncbi:MAG: type II toxin-antitoxin system HicA family toxin [Bryobacteraceae bacterium]